MIKKFENWRDEAAKMGLVEDFEVVKDPRLEKFYNNGTLESDVFTNFIFSKVSDWFNDLYSNPQKLGFKDSFDLITALHGDNRKLYRKMFGCEPNFTFYGNRPYENWVVKYKDVLFLVSTGPEGGKPEVFYKDKTGEFFTEEPNEDVIIEFFTKLLNKIKESDDFQV